jgi:hypothetical protein
MMAQWKKRSSSAVLWLGRPAANEGQWNAQRFAAHHMGVNALVFAPKTDDQGSLTTMMGSPAVRFATGGCDNLIKIWRYLPTSSPIPTPAQLTSSAPGTTSSRATPYARRS